MDSFSPIEMTLMPKKVTNGFQIPPLTTAKGHVAEDWRGKQMWTGHTRVVMEGSEKCKIQLVNDDGSVFAQSIIKDDKWENLVQRTVDSSRFFALLLINEKTG